MTIAISIFTTIINLIVQAVITGLRAALTALQITAKTLFGLTKVVGKAGVAAANKQKDGSELLSKNRSTESSRLLQRSKELTVKTAEDVDKTVKLFGKSFTITSKVAAKALLLSVKTVIAFIRLLIFLCMLVQTVITLLGGMAILGAIALILLITATFGAIGLLDADFTTTKKISVGEASKVLVDNGGGDGKIHSEIGNKFVDQITLLNSADIDPSRGLQAPIIGWNHPHWNAGVLNDSDKAIIEAFAEEHFEEGMSAGEKACITWDWIHSEVTYPYGAAFNALEGVSSVECIFQRRMGQCLQYNGAMEAMLLYLGFDAREVHGSRSRDVAYTPGQGHDHYWCEVNIDDTLYLIDTGNSGDSGDIALTHFVVTFEDAYEIDNTNGFGYYRERGEVKSTTHDHSDW